MWEVGMLESAQGPTARNMKTRILLWVLALMALLTLSALYLVELGPGDSVHIQCVSGAIEIDQSNPYLVNLVCGTYTPEFKDEP